MDRKKREIKKKKKERVEKLIVMRNNVMRNKRWKSYKREILLLLDLLLLTLK